MISVISPWLLGTTNFLLNFIIDESPLILESRLYIKLGVYEVSSGDQVYVE